MAKRDFFTPLNPTERAVRIVRGREALLSALAVPAARGAVDNDVIYTGSFTTRDDPYDAFTVTVNGPTEVPDAERKRFAALGCTVVSTVGSVAIVHKRHALYDDRWWQVDMSAGQCAVAFLALSLAALLAVAAALV